jgi:hypothetical protein
MHDLCIVIIKTLTAQNADRATLENAATVIDITPSVTLLRLSATDVYRNLVFISVSYSIPKTLRSKQYAAKYLLVKREAIH